MDTDTTTPLGPAGSDTGRWATPAPAAMPAAPPTYVDSPPLWGPPGASIPPVAGPPSWSTGPAGTPPAPPSVAPGPLPSRGGGGGTGRAVRSALVAFAVFAAGAGGVAVGANLVDDTGGSARLAPAGTGETATVSPTGVTVAGDAEEPVAAVAAVLAPAVVQIETDTGLGSGFVYDADGLIMTAAHVVEGASSVTVRFANGNRASGTVVGTDSSTDVGVIRVTGVDDLAVATLALGVDLQVGQTAVAIGSPFGLDQTVTAGIVSAVGRSTETSGSDGVTRAIPAIQTDAPINSGNSGGALADRNGRVIGINSSIITADASSSGNVGVGFAVPIDIAKAVADRLVAGTSTVSGYLGVSSADATGSVAGAEIQRVESGAPAASAGLEVGDLVVAFDGRSIGSAIDLVAAVTTHVPGDEVELTVLRDGDEVTVTVTLDESPY
jgi:putative serine protease PepD